MPITTSLFAKRVPATSQAAVRPLLAAMSAFCHRATALPCAKQAAAYDEIQVPQVLEEQGFRGHDWLHRCRSAISASLHCLMTILNTMFNENANTMFKKIVKYSSAQNLSASESPPKKRNNSQWMEVEGRPGSFRRRGDALPEEHEQEDDQLCNLLVAQLEL